MLTLPIKAKWYDMIRDLVKLEEYRGDTTYYARLLGKHEGKMLTMRLRNGYRRDSRTLELAVIPRRRKGARPEWGGDPDELGWVLEIQPGTMQEVVPRGR